MIKILFLIHDLGQGGAEKVLVNLVNNMDVSKFDVTVMSLFDVGVNRKSLRAGIRYKTCFSKMIPGNSHIMKLLSPQLLHKIIIREKYDIEVSYLEGPCARIISGCPDPRVKKVCWIHSEQHTTERAIRNFRNLHEANECYNRFDRIICVSETVKQDFSNILQINVPIDVLYNTNETKKIMLLSEEKCGNTHIMDPKTIKLVGVGKLLKNKGFDRLLRIVNKLVKENYNIHLFLLGQGTEENVLKKYVRLNSLETKVDFLGYQENPYKFVAKCDLFVCASHSEGFSTAATEALIVGTPVCTTEVSGMREMLGENNEYGIVVENNEEALYQGIKKLMDHPDLLEYYKKQAIIRGKAFSTEETVKTVENMLLSL